MDEETREELEDLMEELDYKWDTPQRNKIVKELKELFDEIDL